MLADPLFGPVNIQTVIISLVIIVFAYYYLKRRQFYAIIDRIPGPKCNLPLLGNADLFWEKGQDMGVTMLYTLQRLANEYRKQGIFRYYLGSMPIVVIYEAHHMETILGNSVLIKKPQEYDLIQNWLGESLLTSGGNVWKRKRKLLNPAFHVKNLQDFIPTFNKKAEILCNIMGEKSPEDDIAKYTIACTLDIIVETTLGVKIEAQSNPWNPYAKSLHEYGLLYIQRVLSPWLWNEWVFSLFPSGKEMKHHIQVMHDFNRSIIRMKIQERIKSTNDGDQMEKGQDLMGTKKRRVLSDLLLDYHLNDGIVSQEEIRAEVETFTFAGHDTSGIAIAYCLLLLGNNPGIEETLFQELESIFGNEMEREVTLEDIKGMNYMEAVIKETLRLYPSVPIIGRVLTEDVVIGGRFIPKGVSIYNFLYALHRDPEVFPDPEEFRPERFLDEDLSQKRHPYAYAPFALGPRNCIGQKFALLSMKIILAHILRRFQVKSLDTPQNLILSEEIILKPKTPLRVAFTKRF
jgi:cytochrome P450